MCFKAGVLIPVGGSPGDPNLNATWARCVIILYSNRITERKNRYETLTNTQDFTLDEWIDSATMHELGHSLKLAHPRKGTVKRAIPIGEGSVMRSGGITNPPLLGL